MSNIGRFDRNFKPALTGCRPGLSCGRLAPAMKIAPQTDFGTRECPGCALEVPANENRCPVCGYEFPVRGPLHRNVLGIVLLMLALLLLPLLLSLR